jgi:hypothetical protein
MIRYVRLRQKNRVIGYSSRSDDCLGKFRPSDFKNNQSGIFSLAEESRNYIIDELIVRLKHKVKLPMVLFPKSITDLSEADAILFSLYQEEIGLPNRVS